MLFLGVEQEISLTSSHDKQAHVGSLVFHKSGLVDKHVRFGGVGFEGGADRFGGVGVGGSAKH